MRIRESTRRYEDWLRGELREAVVEAHLAKKHDRMRESPFSFLRATYWRWAETAGLVTRREMSAPAILAIGDIHLENFGTWRDAEGSLIWGVNDFDEAALMPWSLDLIRLAASAMLARDAGPKASICEAIWKGYMAGLAEPQPIVLERDHRWLREAILLPERARAKWWARLEGRDEPIPARFRRALSTAMPDPEASLRTFARTAGTGSLGRPRYAAVAEWRGGPVVRECKAILPSAWSVFAAGGPAPILAGEIAVGRARAADPHYRVADGLVVRRLSPNSRKIEVEDAAEQLVSPEMLKLMGREIANCHVGDEQRIGTVREDAGRRAARWLEEPARAAAEAVRRDYNDL